MLVDGVSGQIYPLRTSIVSIDFCVPLLCEKSQVNQTHPNLHESDSLLGFFGDCQKGHVYPHAHIHRRAHTHHTYIDTHTHTHTRAQLHVHTQRHTRNSPASRTGPRVCPCRAASSRRTRCRRGSSRDAAASSTRRTWTRASARRPGTSGSGGCSPPASP